MTRGDFEYHLYDYIDNNNKLKNIGLTCWKDRVLSPEMKMGESDFCICRLKTGGTLVTVK
jgi:hypothetical protein